MLISPPFLIARGANQSEDAWIDACMTGGAFGDGGFPVSSYFGWHGGVHLNAPMVGTTAEPVRAIADGIVAYVRQPTERPAEPDAAHPQMYRGQWTDNGVVIIRHDTEIGEGANGRVVFYSIYVHLRRIAPGLAANRAVYRKAEIGAAGRIYGQPDKIHFEIICDDANLTRLVGRGTGDCATNAHGRADAVYGEVYIHLPSGAQVFAQKPLSNNTVAHMQPPKPPGQPLPAPVALHAVHTTTEALLVGLRYVRGDALLTSYTEAGTTHGPALREVDAEYELYTVATKISEAHPATGRPAPSAVYELLRFGRVIGPDALNPATVPHWRQVCYSATAQGWVNLNAPGVRCFSDADFPQWRGWKLIADDTNADARCDSAQLKDLLKSSPAEVVTDAELRTRAALPSNAGKLKKTICKFPTEWDSATIDARWGWIKTTQPEPLSNEDFEVLRAHITAVAFWAPANLRDAQGAVVPAAHWHFEPREFIRHFRMCGWLSKNEFSQTFPRRLLHLQQGQFHAGITSWNTANSRAENWKLAFNKAGRRYGVSNTPLRLIHLMANIVPETGTLSLVREIGGQNASYAPYYGRGLIQLTHLENYRSYGIFRRFPSAVVPQAFAALGWDPDVLIARDNSGNHNYENCADSACFYVVKRQGMLRHMDAGLGQAESIAVCRDVNGNVSVEKLNGLDGRLQSILFIATVLQDELVPNADVQMIFTWRRNSQKEPVFDAQGQPVMVGNPPIQKRQYFSAQHTINVPMQRQVP